MSRAHKRISRKQFLNPETLALLATPLDEHSLKSHEDALSEHARLIENGTRVCDRLYEKYDWAGRIGVIVEGEDLNEDGFVNAVTEKAENDAQMDPVETGPKPDDQDGDGEDEEEDLFGDDDDEEMEMV